MNTITCEGCGADVVRAHAHIRSRSFAQVGWCQPCWDARDDDRTVVHQYAVEYLDSHGDRTRDVFETCTEALRRRAYLAARGRASTFLERLDVAG